MISHEGLKPHSTCAKMACPPRLSVPCRVLASKDVDSSMVAGDTQEGGVLVEVDTGRGEGNGYIVCGMWCLGCEQFH